MLPETLLYMTQMNTETLSKKIRNQKLYSKCNYKNSSKWQVRPIVTIQGSKDTQICKISDKWSSQKRYYTWLKWTLGHCWDKSETKNYTVNVIIKIPPNDNCAQTLLYKRQNVSHRDQKKEFPPLTWHAKQLISKNAVPAVSAARRGFNNSTPMDNTWLCESEGSPPRIQ